MELGEKLRLARTEAGMSQRQLAADIVTRNMLSQIENGAARPSMRTLQAFAQRLNLPMGYFLEEDAMLSPNQGRILAARAHFDAGRFREALTALESFRERDNLFDRERTLLWSLCRLSLAQRAVEEGRIPYARTLLEDWTGEGYCREDLERRRLLLLGRLRAEPVSQRLPSLDEELMLRGREALASGEPSRAARLLEAAQTREADWQLLRGEIHFVLKEFSQAARCFRRAEDTHPAALGRLEDCYRELGDYRLAYEYACRRREGAKEG